MNFDHSEWRGDTQSKPATLSTSMGRRIVKFHISSFPVKKMWDWQHQSREEKLQHRKVYIEQGNFHNSHPRYEISYCDNYSLNVLPSVPEGFKDLELQNPLGKEIFIGGDIWRNVSLLLLPSALLTCRQGFLTIKTILPEAMKCGPSRSEYEIKLWTVQ